MASRQAELSEWAQRVIAQYHVERPMEDAEAGKRAKDFPDWQITSWDFPPGRHFVRWLLRAAGYKRMRDALQDECRCPLCRPILSFAPHKGGP